MPPITQLLVAGEAVGRHQRLRFFRDLDRQLPVERGPLGQPSTTDPQSVELIRIVDAFATNFDELPELIPGRSDDRVPVSSGVLVPRFAAIGQLAADGAVELVELEVDFEG